MPNRGEIRWHQLLFQLPVLKDNDPYYTGVKKFLMSKFFFKEESRLISVGRSAPSQGTPKWLDLVFFQAQASQDIEFGVDY